MLTIGNGHNVLYLGEVVAFHLSNAVYANGKIDSERLRPVARLGGPFYTGLGKIWHFPPSAKGR
jgi:flavin reductase (DIM6/NTAB) family NADH-FMN oxidoreductase RutF